MGSLVPTITGEPSYDLKAFQPSCLKYVNRHSKTWLQAGLGWWTAWSYSDMCWWVCVCVRVPPAYKDIRGTSRVVPWLRVCLPIQGIQVWSLVREIRSHMPCSQKKNKNQNTKQKWYCNKFSKDCKNGLHNFQALEHKYHLEDHFSAYHTTKFQHIL